VPNLSWVYDIVLKMKGKFMQEKTEQNNETINNIINTIKDIKITPENIASLIETHIIPNAAKIKGVCINREEFLKRELSLYINDASVIDLAIEKNPAYAGISKEIIDKIANSVINKETNTTTGISFVTGLPGGITMALAIPADFVQNTCFAIRLAQELAYLYGFDEFNFNNCNSELNNKIMVLLAAMYGVDVANKALKEFAKSVSVNVAKQLAKAPLTKGVLYPIIKQICKTIGIKISKQIFAKSVSKAVPVIGGVVCGAITYVTFKPMAEKLKTSLEQLDICNPEFYENNKIEI